MSRSFTVVATIVLTVAVARAQSEPLECFRVKDPEQRARLAPVTQGITLPVGCQIKVAAKLVCARPAFLPAEDEGEEATALVCAEVKCDAGASPPTPVVDQVLGEAMKPRRSRLVCTSVTADEIDDTTTTTTTIPPDGVTTTTGSATTTTTVTTPTSTTFVIGFPECSQPNTSCGSCGNGACRPTRPEGRFVCTFQTQGFCEGSCTSSAQCSDGKLCVGTSGELGQCCTPCF
jgi:hypothetical protein